MSPIDITLLVGTIAAGLGMAVFVLALLVYAFTWLSILWMKRFDPAAYERFRIIHNLRKGAWKRR